MGQDDSRRFPRIPSRNAVLVKETRDGDEAFVPTRTMSLGGCSFMSQEEIGSGEVLELLISVDQRVISAPARVVYSRLSDDSRYEVGVEFGDLAAEDREVLGGLLEVD